MPILFATLSILLLQAVVLAVAGMWSSAPWLFLATVLPQSVLALRRRQFQRRQIAVGHQISEVALRASPLTRLSTPRTSPIIDGYNLVAHRVSEILRDIRHAAISTVVDNVELHTRLTVSAEAAREQGAQVHAIERATEEVTRDIGAVTSHAQAIAATAQAQLTLSHATYDSLLNSSKRIAAIGQELDEYSETVGDLSQAATQVLDVVKLIKEISGKTNLLALNAAIEAARAGESGAGFAVVADEVRKLSQHTHDATANIDNVIKNMLMVVDAASLGTRSIIQTAGDVRQDVSNCCTHFGDMVRELEGMAAQVAEIGQASESVLQANQAIHDKVTAIAAMSATVEHNMRDAEQRSSLVAEANQSVQTLSMALKIGSGTLESTIEQLQPYRDRIVAVLQAKLDQGTDIFDQQYREIPGTQPIRFHTQYDQQVEGELQALYDSILQTIPGASSTIAVDINGYCPIHCSKFSQPWTGDPDKVRKFSRQKMKFDDAVGLRSARNSQEFLLQTYFHKGLAKVFTEVALPITLRGRLWGNLRLNVDPAHLLRVDPNG